MIFELNIFIYFVLQVYVAQCSSLTKEERYALTRDGLSRANPDALFDGYFAAWPVILLALSGEFLSLWFSPMAAYYASRSEKSLKSLRSVFSHGNRFVYWLFNWFM